MILLALITSIINNPCCLLFTSICGALLKFGLLLTLLYNQLKEKYLHKHFYLFLGIVFCAFFHDFSWILLIITRFFYPCNITHLTQRLAWFFNIFMMQSLGLFLDYLTSKKQRISLHSKIFLPLNIFFMGIYLYFALQYFNIFNRNLELLKWVQFYIMNISTSYNLLMLFVSSIITVFKVQKIKTPYLLKKQIYTLIQFYIAPLLLVEFVQLPLFRDITIQNSLCTSYTAVTISSILMTIMLYYCIKKVMVLRFLNMKKSVQTVSRLSFIKEFRKTLDELSMVESLQELYSIAYMSFESVFNIPSTHTFLTIRQVEDKTFLKKYLPDHSAREAVVEEFLNTYKSNFFSAEQEYKILVHDELAFTNFYEPSKDRECLIQFLEKIDADVFIPIYLEGAVVSYIIVNRHSRKDQFFGHVEQNEMIIFARYLSTVIHLIQNKDLSNLIAHKKKLQDELYIKNQESLQYKESLQSFVRSNEDKNTGVVFYKGRRFTLVNQAAKQLVSINVNAMPGHPLSQKLIAVVKHVKEHNQPYSVIAKNAQDKKLVLSGMNCVDNNQIVITVNLPDVSDLIKQNINALQDPSQWDYLLYLETTKSGTLINTLLPGTGPEILKSKIALLKASLSKKPLLLSMPTDDVDAIAETVHHISLREKLHVFKLTDTQSSHDFAVSVFGINKFFNGMKDVTPILAQVETSATIFIQNIENLALDHQKRLVDYLTHGDWEMLKSEQRRSGTARIICSTSQTLSTLLQDGLISVKLHDILKENCLTLPSLLTLADEEVVELMQEYSSQALVGNDFKNILELTAVDRNKILKKRPISFQKLKHKVHIALTKKSYKSDATSNIDFTEKPSSNNPEVAAAIRLGKHAMKDPKIMKFLWDKFKNQSQIATLLGVNRSSVNRRGKEHGIF